MRSAFLLFRPLILTVAIVFAFSGGGQAAAACARAQGAGMTDTAWSWWTHPTAGMLDGSLLIGGIGSDGDLKIWRNGQPASLGTIQADDHNAPALALEPGHAPVIFSPEHNISKVLWYRIGLDGVWQAIWFPGLVTYAQVLTEGARIVLLTRVESCQWWAVASDDWAQSWGDPVKILDGCDKGGLIYLTTGPSSTPGIYHVAAYGHPINSTWREIDYGRLDMNALAPLHLQPAVKAQEERLLDVGEIEGQPAILYAAGGQDWFYRVAQRSAEGWTVTDLATVGGAFWAPSGYIGGAVFDDAGGVVLSRSSGGTWTVEGHADGITELASSSEPLVRPIIAGGHVIVQQLGCYADPTHFSATAKVLN